MDAKEQQEFDAELRTYKDKITGQKTKLAAKSKSNPADASDLNEDHKTALEEAGLLLQSDTAEKKLTEKQKSKMTATLEKYAGLSHLQTAIDDYLKAPLTDGVRSFNALETLHQEVQLISAQDEVRRAGGIVKKQGKLASLGKLISSVTDSLKHPTKALINDGYALIHKKYESEQAAAHKLKS
jgi:hypothetical protein